VRLVSAESLAATAVTAALAGQAEPPPVTAETAETPETAPMAVTAGPVPTAPRRLLPVPPVVMVATEVPERRAAPVALVVLAARQPTDWPVSTATAVAAATGVTLARQVTAETAPPELRRTPTAATAAMAETRAPQQLEEAVEPPVQVASRAGLGATVPLGGRSPEPLETVAMAVQVFHPSLPEPPVATAGQPETPAILATAAQVEPGVTERPASAVSTESTRAAPAQTPPLAETAE